MTKPRTRQRTKKNPGFPPLTDTDIAQLTHYERDAECHKRAAALSEAARAFVWLHLDPADTRPMREKAVAAGLDPQPMAKAVDILELPHVRDILRLSASIRRDQYAETEHRAMEQLASIAYADVSDLFVPEIDPDTGKPTGNWLFALDRASPRQIAALSIDIETDDRNRIVKKKIRRSDPLPAIDRIARHLGLYADERAGANAMDRIADAFRRLSDRTAPARPGVYAALADDPDTVQGEAHPPAQAPLPSPQRH